MSEDDLRIRGTGKFCRHDEVLLTQFQQFAANNPGQASPGTIRADFGLQIGRNLVHGSDGPDTAAYEIPLYFTVDEILGYERAVDAWINE